MLCPSCGKTIPDCSTLCPGCGTKLASGKKKVAALIPCRKGRTWGFCNRDREMVIPAIYDSADPFCNDFARVSLSGKWGFVDASGNMAIPAIYDGALSFREGLARVNLNGKWGFVNASGNMTCLLYTSDAADEL